MSFLLVSRGSRVDFKKWKSLHQPDFKRDSNLGGFGNAELRLCQPNVSREVKKYIVGAEVGKSHRSSHKETLRLQTATTECGSDGGLIWKYSAAAHLHRVSEQIQDGSLGNLQASL